MTLLHKVDITTSPRGNYGSTIKLDGHDVAGGVRGFTLTQEVGKVATLELELVVIQEARVAIDEVDVFIDARSIDILERLGWRHPERPARGANVVIVGKVM